VSGGGSAKKKGRVGANVDLVYEVGKTGEHLTENLRRVGRIGVTSLQVDRDVVVLLAVGREGLEVHQVACKFLASVPVVDFLVFYFIMVEEKRVFVRERVGSTAEKSCARTVLWTYHSSCLPAEVKGKNGLDSRPQVLVIWSTIVSRVPEADHFRSGR